MIGSHVAPVPIIELVLSLPVTCSWCLLFLGLVPCCTVAVPLKYNLILLKQATSLVLKKLELFLVCYSFRFTLELSRQITKSFHWDFYYICFCQIHIFRKNKCLFIVPFSPTKSQLCSPLLRKLSYTKLIKFCGFLHESSTPFSWRTIQR